MKRYLIAILLATVCLKTFAINLSSQDIKANATLKSAQIASSFGCTGKNLSPQLSWSDIPANTKSFAITMYDPDAPTGSGFWHWIAYNINSAALVSGASTTKNMPLGSIEIENDAGVKGYLGGCPPNGKHRYIFTVYALDVDKLPVKDDAPSAIARFVIMKHTIAKSSITTYGLHQ